MLNQNRPPPPDRAAALLRLLRERIVILDGAMGTMIQTYRLSEEGYRGARFRDWPRDVQGNNDLLNLTQPKIVQSVHRQYLEAGADIIETNTFNSTTISMADYGMESLAHELNVAGAQNARAAADAVMAANPGRTCWVAGALGPTNKTASLSGDVSNPAARSITYDQLAGAYHEQARGLLEGGADMLLVETVFDSLNSKAALFAIARLFEDWIDRPARPRPAGHRRLPVMLSFTITDLSGRTLSGQTVEAYWNSVSHFPLLSIGINCALGPKEMRPFIEELSGLAPIYVSAYPNAGLPNPMLADGLSGDAGNASRRNWRNGPKPAGSTSSAAAAAPPRRTSRPWRRRCGHCRRACRPSRTVPAPERAGSR